MASHTFFMRSNISDPQGRTAPSAMEIDSSGTSDASSTVRTMPVPEHVGQAPPPLKERSSAEGAQNSRPQAAQRMGLPAATLSAGTA